MLHKAARLVTAIHFISMLSSEHESKDDDNPSKPTKMESEAAHRRSKDEPA